MATTATSSAAPQAARIPAQDPAQDPNSRALHRDVCVVAYGRADVDDPGSHQGATLAHVARNVAQIAGYTFAGSYDAVRNGPTGASARMYFVPADTLVGVDSAKQLGITSIEDLFGGVVPQAFIATKAISHGLIRPDARAPEGWSEAFAARVRDCVLPGYTAFDRDDALAAGREMLKGGAVRVKEPCGIGGLGQQVARNEAELVAALEAIDIARIEAEGVVLERNLEDVTTFSVGQVELGGLRASYCGTQTLTKNHDGNMVYGGSTLRAVRGTLEDLLAHPIETHLRDAVRAAIDYHAAAIDCFPGMLISRCNYDVAMGTDNGRQRLGVLEQSWRAGGASGAELAVLKAFRDDPRCNRATASTCERYDANATIPPGADVYFAGEDRNVGALVKFAMLESSSDGNT
ncbi:DUF3182 family protein [Cupriavidus pampae]|uniref:DUF3182 family protein n=1 Tax=Cupriavidus pampae TaxID=659251 RepID=A0ABN7YF51_9BURK|nr:DUF3182 family protein [Cupriavidus pampae]CAG9171329.1 hypothetical protein LMG32289_02313 [Cupriavidus pampae]